MASLGMLLAGSAIGQGAGQFVHQQMQGAFDQQRLDHNDAQAEQTQKEWDYKNNEMDRIRQQQGIENQTVDGATDEDRLQKLADIAGKGGRGDLERKYKSAAMESRQNVQLKNIASASRAITLGQFEPATKMLNQTGLFGNISSIGLADDVEQDPANPTYSVLSPGGPDENGNPTDPRPVHVTQQMLYQLQSKPGDALHWMAYAQAQQGKNNIAQQKADNQEKHYDDQNNHWIRQDANYLKRVGGGANGGRASDFQTRKAWAMQQIGKPEGFTSERTALEWAQDPSRGQKNYWQSLRTAQSIDGSGGDMVSVGTVQKLAEALRGSPISPPSGHPSAPDGTRVRMADGSIQVKRNGAWVKE